MKLSGKKLQVLLLVFFLAFYFRFIYLGSEIFNDDAHFWYQRTSDFVSNLKNSNFAETYRSPHPGVTVLWLSGISKELFLNLYEYKFKFRPLVYTAETFPLVHFATKALLVLTGSLFLILFYFLVQKVFSRRVALFATIFLSFEPFYIGVMRFLHLDGIFSVFMSLSALFIILFLLETEKYKKARYLSAIFAALALLTKSAALFLILFVLFSFISDYFFKKRKVSFYFRSLIIWFVITALSFFILFPAMWVEPLATLDDVFIGGVESALGGKNDLRGSLFYLFVFLLRMSPFSLISFLVGLIFISSTFRKLKKAEKESLFLTFSFIFFYLLQMSLPKQKIDRYFLSVIPFVEIVAAYGVFAIGERFKFNEKLLSSILAIVLVSFLIPVTPHFTTFYNPLFSGRETARRVLQFETVGELYRAAAVYLNEKENPHDLVVICTYIPQSFRPFFKGKTFSVNEELPEGLTLDYIVVPWYEKIPEKFSQKCTLEKEIKFRGLTYWYIYDCRETESEKEEI